MEIQLNNDKEKRLEYIWDGSNLTDWISSSNRSTRKSRHCSPNKGLAKLSRHMESTAANRTSGT